MNENEIDITKNIKIIEILKTRLLSLVSDLFINMTDNTAESIRERCDIIADIVVISYMLSLRLGTPYNALDLKIINKIKLALLSDTDINWQKDLKMLSKHLDNYGGRIK